MTAVETQELDAVLMDLNYARDTTSGREGLELLARIGSAADRRGTRRLVAFTIRGSTGQRIQLSGGWTVYRRRGVLEVRREAGPAER